MSGWNITSNLKSKNTVGENNNGVPKMRENKIGTDLVIAIIGRVKPLRKKVIESVGYCYRKVRRKTAIEGAIK